MPAFMVHKNVTDSQRHTAKLLFDNLLRPDGFGHYWYPPATRGADLVFGAGNGRVVISANGEIQ